MIFVTDRKSDKHVIFYVGKQVSLKQLPAVIFFRICMSVSYAGYVGIITFLFYPGFSLKTWRHTENHADLKVRLRVAFCIFYCLC